MNAFHDQRIILSAVLPEVGGLFGRHHNRLMIMAIVMAVEQYLDSADGTCPDLPCILGFDELVVDGAKSAHVLSSIPDARSWT
jgi:hypothetical protein